MPPPASARKGVAIDKGDTQRIRLAEHRPFQGLADSTHDSMPRPEALVNATPAAALAAWFALLERAGARTTTAIEEVPLADAQGLVVALDVCAMQPIPPFRVAAMDGIAVRAADVVVVPAKLGDQSFAPIDTGEAVGDEWDSVVPVEETSPDRHGIIARAPVTVGQYVRPAGEDIPGAQSC